VTSQTATNPPSAQTDDRHPTPRSAARYLNNDEAAAYLHLSPRTLEKQRVIGGGPKFRKFGRRVVYALEDLESWASARACDTTSDPNYVAVR
jgi:hypothetical protein